jgi:hypothetical protein
MAKKGVAKGRPGTTRELTEARQGAEDLSRLSGDGP